MSGTLKERVVKDLAEAHVNWLLGMLRPLLIEHFVHGYKHGREDSKEAPG